jgi:hypothetical protein
MWPSRPPVRRAARWDGVVPIFYSIHTDEYSEPTPELVRDLAEYAAAHRTSAAPFDIAIGGDLRRAGEFAEAGVTWMRHGWVPDIGDQEQWQAAVLAGPPG